MSTSYFLAGRSLSFGVIAGSLLVTGEVDRTSGFEKGFPVHEAYRDGGWQPDPLILDDQALVANVRGRGLVVLTGCGHSGIVNILRYVRKLTGQGDFHAVVGGFHLSGRAFEPIIEPTCAALAEFDADYLVQHFDNASRGEDDFAFEEHAAADRADQELPVRFVRGRQLLQRHLEADVTVDRDAVHPLVDRSGAVVDLAGRGVVQEVTPVGDHLGGARHELAGMPGRVAADLAPGAGRDVVGERHEVEARAALGDRPEGEVEDLAHRRVAERRVLGVDVQVPRVPAGTAARRPTHRSPARWPTFDLVRLSHIVSSCPGP
jgi:hypothetical protein